MKLSNVEIEQRLKNQEIKITPKLSQKDIGSVSIDLRLGNVIKQFVELRSKYTFGVERPVLDIQSKGIGTKISNCMEDIILTDDNVFILRPKKLILGVTNERIELPTNLVGWLDGRSTLARLGLMVHITAHRVDPGFKGKLTLEMYNVSPVDIMLRPEMKICSLSFETLSSPTTKPYSDEGKYFNSFVPQAAQKDEI